ncbi:MAG: helix-turn-helix transcriptional regulator [Pseudomonadota bacterium]
MDTELRELVLDIYDTVVQPENWLPVLDRIGERLDAWGCLVFEIQREGSGRRVVASHMSSAFEPDLLAQYMEIHKERELLDQNLFEAHSLATDGIDLLDDDILADNDEELFARPNVQTMYAYGIRHRAGGLLNKDNPHRGRFSLQLAEHRLTAAQRTDLDLLLPHIAKAMDLGRPAVDLAALNQGLMTAMDRLSIGVCVMDGLSRIVATNEEFRRQEETHPVLGRDVQGRLSLQSPDAARVFNRLLSDVMFHGQFGARPRKEAIPVSGEVQDGALCLELAPLTGVVEMGTSPLNGAVLYSLDTTRPLHVDMEAVGQVFGLTGTEQELGDLISEGLTNVQIAERRGRALDTIRTQVKSVLAKTGCANRTQLVRLLSGFEGRWIRP